MKVYDRLRHHVFNEEVYGDFFIRLAYASVMGRKVVASPWLQKAVSHVIGAWQNTGFSKKNIAEFIERYRIDMRDFQEPAEGFASFNDFFIRELASGARSFPQNENEMGALAEGRLSVFSIEGARSRLCIKGKNLSVAELVGSEEWAQSFARGHALVFRLCPVDYHRFHFPDAGMPLMPIRLGNRLHSVNPLAQKALPELFLWNERQVTFFQSQHFGPLLMIEVGAMGVGKIHQTYKPSVSVRRGAEKGYFSFGGSTVILLTQRPHFAPDADLIERSELGLESLVRLGEKIGQSL